MSVTLQGTSWWLICLGRSARSHKAPRQFCKELYKKVVVVVFVGIANLGSDGMKVLEVRYKLGRKGLKGVILMIFFSEIILVPCKGLYQCNRK